MYYVIKPININSFIKAKMLLLRATKKQRGAPMLCLSLEAIHVAGVHWKNALDMPSIKRCLSVLEVSAVRPNSCFSKKASKSLYVSWFAYILAWDRGGGNERKSTCVRFKYSNVLINVGAVDDDALDLATILRAKVTVENASITDSTVKSKHVEAFATNYLQGPHSVARSDFFERNKAICSVFTRASDPSKFWSRTCCNISRQVWDANHASLNGINGDLPPSRRESTSTWIVNLRNGSITSRSNRANWRFDLIHETEKDEGTPLRDPNIKYRLF